MDIERLEIPEVLLLRPKRFADERGFFVETYQRRRLAEAGVDVEFLQDNLSHSVAVGTLRGLHYQRPPHAQGKLVSVVAGRILDVAVDVRRGSPTYGRHVKAELSADGGEQLYVPVGFLHGFVTLEPDTRVTYKVSAYYAADCDGAVRWDDPDFGIDWGAGPFKLSPKDAAAPGFSAFESPFIQD
jgi:dTDP-4-dehydrorhamnose 3,5-epimerase